DDPTQMKRSLSKYIFDGLIGGKFRNIGYLPRWIIFMIDVFIVFVASIVTYFIVHTLTNDNDADLNLPIRYALIIFINAFFFLLYRTYAGIIRHSTFIDCVKLLVSTSTSFLTLVAVNFAWY